MGGPKHNGLAVDIMVIRYYELYYITINMHGIDVNTLILDRECCSLLLLDIEGKCDSQLQLIAGISIVCIIIYTIIYIAYTHSIIINSSININSSIIIINSSIVMVMDAYIILLYHTGGRTAIIVIGIAILACLVEDGIDQVVATTGTKMTTMIALLIVPVQLITVTPIAYHTLGQ